MQQHIRRGDEWAGVQEVWFTLVNFSHDAEIGLMLAQLGLDVAQGGDADDLKTQTCFASHDIEQVGSDPVESPPAIKENIRGQVFADHKTQRFGLIYPDPFGIAQAINKATEVARLGAAPFSQCANDLAAL